MRSHGGFNNNPTVKQFKFAFKKLIIRTEIKEDKTGNCMPLEEISILHIPSTTDSISIINATSNQNSSTNWLNIGTTYNDHNYLHLHLLPFTTEYKNEIITYIAGYITRKLTKSLHCIECVNALIEQNIDVNCNFINMKKLDNKRRINISVKGSCIYMQTSRAYDNRLHTYK